MRRNEIFIYHFEVPVPENLLIINGEELWRSLADIT